MLLTQHAGDISSNIWFAQKKTRIMHLEDPWKTFICMFLGLRLVLRRPKSQYAFATGYVRPSSCSVKPVVGFMKPATYQSHEGGSSNPLDTLDFVEK